jgi:hypothetical protein
MAPLPIGQDHQGLLEFKNKLFHGRDKQKVANKFPKSWPSWYLSAVLIMKVGEGYNPRA